MVIALVVGSLIRGQIRDYHHSLGREKGHNLCTPIGSPQSILEINENLHYQSLAKEHPHPIFYLFLFFFSHMAPMSTLPGVTLQG